MMMGDSRTTATGKADEIGKRMYEDELREVCTDPVTKSVDSLNIPVGDSAKDYSIGDYLNAIDAVTCYFQAHREQRDIDLAAALRMYADNIEPDVGLP